MTEPKFIVITEEKRTRLLNGKYDIGCYPANTDKEILNISNQTGVLKATAYNVGGIYKSHTEIITMGLKKQEVDEKAQYERLKKKFEKK